MKANVISLVDSPRRSIAIDRAKSVGLEISFFDAINASTDSLVQRTYSASAKNFQRRYGRNQTHGELATMLSHQSLYKFLAQHPMDYHLILEDDFIPLVDVSLLKKLLNSAINHNVDLLLLGYSKIDDEIEKAINITNPLMNSLTVEGTDRIIGKRCYETTCGAVSFLVSPRFIKAIENNVDYGRLADDWTYYEQFGLKINHAKPLCFREDFFNMPSSLEDARAKLSNRNRFNCPTCIRPYWRMFLRVLNITKFYWKKMRSNY